MRSLRWTSARSADEFWWESPRLWCGFAIVSAIPLMIASRPMLPDSFSHIGRYYVMLHANEPGIAQFYSYRWALFSNLGVDLLVWLFAHFFSVELTARLVIGLIPTSNVAGIYAVCRAATGRIPPGALVALNLVWSFPLLFGFINFSLGVGLAFLCAALWISVASTSGLRLVIGIGAAFLLWLCHLAAFGIFLVIVGSYIFVKTFRDSLPSRAAAVAELLFLCSPLLIRFVERQSDHSVPILGTFAYDQKASLAKQLLREHYQIFDKISALIVFGLVATVLFIGVKNRKVNAALLLSGGGLALSFLLFPIEIMGSYFADIRLLPSAIILLLLAAGGSQRTGHIIAIIGLTLFISRTGLMTRDWYVWSSRADRDLRALSYVPPGSRIATFACLEGCASDDSWRINGYDHLASLAIPRRRAFVNNEWDVSGNGLVPIYNRGRGYNDVSSVTVVPNYSLLRPKYWTVEQRLAGLPRDRFDFVWVFNQPFDERAFPWLKALYRGPAGVLFSIER